MSKPLPTSPPPKKPVLHRFGWWLLITLWPAIAVFVVVAWLVWDKTDANTAWALAGGAALLFFAIWMAFRVKARRAGRRALLAFKGFVVSLLVVAALVGAVYLIFFR